MRIKAFSSKKKSIPAKITPTTSKISLRPSERQQSGVIRRILGRPWLQAKLSESTLNDFHDQKADRGSAAIMGVADATLLRQPLEGEEEPLQTKSVDHKLGRPDLQRRPEQDGLADVGRIQPKLRTGADEQLLTRERIPVVSKSSPPGYIQRGLLDDIISAGAGLAAEGAELLEGGMSAVASLGEEAAREIVRQMILQCNQMPASVCANPECPPCFCSPLPLTNAEILIFRDLVAAYTLPGIAGKVNPRVVPLWSTYLYGGSSQQDLSASFGNDFMASQTTRRMNAIVEAELRRAINPRSQLPNEIDIPTRIPRLIRQINDSNHANAMNFNVIGEIPGNIAGGIGQQNCSAGARPSTTNDQRTIEGRATVVRSSPTSVTVIPNMFYVVTDTIDLCPGNCGAEIEQIATLPMSWLEASGVSGDVPFVVRYPAMLMPFTINA